MIERMRDAALLAQMGPGEKLLGALQAALLGMGVTFVVLLVLMGCIRLFSRLAAEKPPKAPAAPAAPAAQDGAPDEETVAALLCAVAMMEGGREYRVVNIAPAHAPHNWVTQGRAEGFAAHGAHR